VASQFHPKKLLIPLGFIIGLALIVLGLNSAQTGREAQKLPAEVSSINPGPGDIVLRQSQIFVDFIDGYNAVLILDGLELPVTRLDELSGATQMIQPGAQVDIPATAIYDPGNFTISFQPQAGAAITGLFQGKHTASVLFWKIDATRDKAKSFTWEFSVN